MLMGFLLKVWEEMEVAEEVTEGVKEGMVAMVVTLDLFT
jgi:hypothetical protein